MASARRIGLLVVLVLALIATVGWFVRPSPSVKYAGAAGGVAATVSLRLDGIAPPSTITVDLGQGVRVVASRLP